MKDLKAKMENQEADMAQLKEELRQAWEESQKKFDEEAELLRHVLRSLGTSGSGERLGCNKKKVNKNSRSPSPARSDKSDTRKTEEEEERLKFIPVGLKVKWRPQPFEAKEWRVGYAAWNGSFKYMRFQRLIAVMPS